MPTALTPPNPDFEAAVRESFARQAHMATLGVTIEPDFVQKAQVVTTI